MPQIEVTFTTVPSAVAYEVCYRPTGITPPPAFTCATYNATGLTLPIIISNNIQYNVSYDVTVKAICGDNFASTVVSVIANKIQAPVPTGLCYTVYVFREIPQGTFVRYQPPGGNVTDTDIHLYPFDADNFISYHICSEIPVTLVDFQGNTVNYTANGSSITEGTDPCTNNLSCSSNLYNEFSGVGVGSDACSDHTFTVYSNCWTFGVTHIGCILYWDIDGTMPILNEPYFWHNGVLYTLNQSTGAITGTANPQCP